MGVCSRSLRCRNPCWWSHIVEHRRSFSCSRAPPGSGGPSLRGRSIRTYIRADSSTFLARRSAFLRGHPFPLKCRVIPPPRPPRFETLLSCGDDVAVGMNASWDTPPHTATRGDVCAIHSLLCPVGARTKRTLKRAVRPPAATFARAHSHVHSSSCARLPY